jgi:hypothetical protein
MPALIDIGRKEVNRSIKSKIISVKKMYLPKFQAIILERPIILSAHGQTLAKRTKTGPSFQL